MTLNRAAVLCHEALGCQTEREFRHRLTQFWVLNSYYHRLGADVDLDLVNARGRRGTVTLHLGHLCHRLWYCDGVNTYWRLNLTEKVLVCYMFEAKLRLFGWNSIKSNGQYYRAVAVTTDDQAWI